MRAGKTIKTLVAVALLILSVIFMGYPYLANLLYEKYVDSKVETVHNIEQNLTDSEKDTLLNDAYAYNKELAGKKIPLTDPYDTQNDFDSLLQYQAQLNLTEDGIMGIVEIPKIHVKLPIFHGTAVKVLEKGVGHLYGTSLPVGGETTHAVLTGHTGMHSAKMFTDLIDLEKGDVFYIYSLGEKLVYKVDQIKVVLPTDVSDLKLVEKKDYCTLITCTPYGMNTHRLLVRGTRIKADQKEIHFQEVDTKNYTSKWMKEYKAALAISFLGMGSILFLFLICRHVCFRRKNKSARREDE